MNQSSTEPATIHADAVVGAQIEHAYGQLPIALFVNLINGVILAALLWGATDTDTIRLWLVALILVTAGRLALLQSFRRATRLSAVEPVWGRLFVIGACAAGLVWASAAPLLFPSSSFPHRVFITFVLGGMVAGAMPVLMSLKRAYAYFTVPITFVTSARLLAEGDPAHQTMGILILIFGAAMLLTAVRVGKMFRNTIELQLQLSLSNQNRLELERLLRIDELTNIPNRRHFDETFANEWRRARREGTELSLIIADIDHFKAYNDSRGHPAGDRCLARVAQTLAKTLRRPGDLAARIGGEEFACVLPNTTAAGAAVIAEHLRANVKALDMPHGGAASADRVTISLGVASSAQEAAVSPAELLRLADEALYQAKLQGRNQVVISRK